MSELLGRPITGDKTESHRSNVEQRPVEEWLEALDKLLDVEGVLAVQWSQYTDYFMDGEPCTFSVHDAVVALTFGNVDDYDENEYYDTYDLWDYKDDSLDWSARTAEYNRVYSKSGFDTKEIHDALNEFNKDHGAAFENVLLETFGEHATVTATKDGFDIQFCDHD